MIQRRQFIGGSLATIAALTPTTTLWGRAASFFGSNVSPAADPIGQWHCHVVQTIARDGCEQPPVVTGVALQPGGRWLAVVGDDHVVSMFDRSRMEFVSHFIRHKDWVRTARFTSDGQSLLTAGNDGRLYSWDPANIGQHREIAQHPAAICEIRISRDNRRVAVVGFEKMVRVYDIASGRRELEIEGPCNDLNAVAFSPDDSKIAAAGRNGVVRVWDAASGKTLSEMRPQTSRVRSLEFTSATSIACCGDHCRIVVADIETPAQPHSLGRHKGKLYTVKSLGAERVATGGADDAIHVWNLKTNQLIESLSGHTGTVSSLDYADETLVSGSYDTQVRIWQSQRQAAAMTPTVRPMESIWKQQPDARNP